MFAETEDVSLPHPSVHLSLAFTLHPSPSVFRSIYLYHFAHMGDVTSMFPATKILKRSMEGFQNIFARESREIWSHVEKDLSEVKSMFLEPILFPPYGTPLPPFTAKSTAPNDCQQLQAHAGEWMFGSVGLFSDWMTGTTNLFWRWLLGDRQTT